MDMTEINIIRTMNVLKRDSSDTSLLFTRDKTERWMTKVPVSFKNYWTNEKIVRALVARQLQTGIENPRYCPFF